MNRSFTKKVFSIPEKIAGTDKDFLTALPNDYHFYQTVFDELSNIFENFSVDAELRARAIFVMFIYFPSSTEKKRKLIPSLNHLYAHKYLDRHNPFYLGKITPDDFNVFNSKASGIIEILKSYALELVKSSRFNPEIKASALALLLLLTTNESADPDSIRELKQILKTGLINRFNPYLTLTDQTIIYLTRRIVFLKNN